MILLMTTAPPIRGPWIQGRRFPPIGLAYVAAALEKEGFQVEIFDNYLLKQPIDYVKLKIKSLAPEIVGITCGSATYQRCVETAKAVKEVLPSCKVVVGGWHPSFMPDSMLRHPEIDYVIMGEGERSTVELASHIKSIRERIAIVDSLTMFTTYSDEDNILEFLTSLKNLCDKGYTILITLHQHAFKEDTLVRIRSACDCHLFLRKEQLTDRYISVMEVSKIRGAKKSTGNIVSFEVQPGFGLKIIPISQAKV